MQTMGELAAMTPGWHSTLLAASQGSDEHFTASAFFAQFSPSTGEHSPPLLREMLAYLWRQQTPRIASLRYPDSVRSLVHKEFDRIAKACEKEADTYFDLTRHALRSDFRILGFGRVPVGPEHLEVSGVPRSLLYRGGYQQAWRFVRAGCQAGGFRPFYELHLSHRIHPKSFLLSYSAATQKAMFHRVAECLALHPEIRGVFAGTWWYDPQITQHCPYLGFLQEGWVSRGAYLFRWGVGADITALATANSPPRQALVQQGLYVPTSYTVVWPRAALLRWAEGDKP